MEQNDSLRQELQNLARIEEEQRQLLKEMNSTQKSEAASRQSSAIRYNAMNDSFADANKSTRSNPFNANGNMIAYGDPAPYAPYQPGYSTNPFGGAVAYAGQSMMNPFGSQARAAQDYYKQTQAGIAGKNLSIWDVVAPSSKTSMKNRDLMGMEYGNRFGTAAITATGAAASFGVNWGLAGALPGLAGMGVALGGGALIGAYTGMAVDESKQNNALAKYIYKTSGMYIDSGESNNDRMLTGFSRKESHDAANFVRKMNDDFYMSNDDISTLLQEFTEGGMLRDVKDLDSFKERMTSLTKTVKEGAILLDETYDSIAQLMADMKKIGIDSKNYTEFMGLGNILEGLTGENASEIIRNLQDYIKNALSGTDYNANDELTRLENTSVYVSNYFDELERNQNRNVLEESNYNYIKNMGGAIEATKQLDNVMNQIVKSDEFENPALMFFDYDTNQKDFVFNQDKYKDFMSGNYTLQDIYTQGSDKFVELQMSGNSEAIDRWRNNAHSYIKNNLTGDMQTDLVQKTLQTYADDPSLIAKGFDERTILSMFGITDSGLQNFIAGTLAYKDGNPTLISQTNLQNMWQQDTAANLAQTPSLTEWVSSGWEGFTDNITQGAVNMNQALGEGIQWMVDKATGYDRRLSPRYDQTFITRSQSLDSIEYEEVKNSRDEVGREIASTKYYLDELKGRGYTISDELMGYVGQKYDVHSDDTVNYKRKLIADWESVDSSTKENKDLIQQLAGGKDLSETIVAALLKYNQQKPDEKLDIDKLTSSLEANMIAYGGNEKFALAASLDPNIASSIDSSLKQMGYDMNSLRSTGMQEVVANLSLDGLGLSEDILNQINEIINQDIGGSGPTQSNPQIDGKDLSEIDFKNLDLSSPSGLSKEQIQAVIDANTADKPNSILRQEGVAEAFYNAEKEYGVSAAFMLALSGQEGTWGDSNISKQKNNPFGWGANDRNPLGDAKQWDSAADGITSFAEAVSKNYINSDKHDQNTLQKMMQGSSYDPGHRYNAHQSWVDGNASLLEKVYTQAGGVSFDGESTNPVHTTSEEVYRDKDGNKLTKEQMDIISATEGFGTSTEDIQKMNKFLASADVVNTPSKYLEVTEKDLMNKFKNDFNTLRDDQSFGTYKKIAGSMYWDAVPDPVNSMTFGAVMSGLVDSFSENYDPTKSIDEMLSRDKQIKKQYEVALKMFTKDNQSVGEEYIKDMLKEVTVEKEVESKQNKGYEVLQLWGREYLDFGLEDVNSDIGAYNQILTAEATNWYRDNVRNLEAFVGGDEKDPAYKMWERMTADEKNKTYDTLKLMQDAVGARDDINGITRMDTLEGDGLSKDKIYSTDDSDKLKYLHQKPDGSYYYDASDGSANSTWEDYELWNKTGRKESSVGAMEKEILDSIGVSGLDGMTATQLMSSIYNQKDTIMRENAESWETARDIGLRMLDGKYTVSGLSDEQAKAVANMVASGDTAGLEAFKERALSNGMSFDQTSIDAFISLTKAINDTDISVLTKLVSGVQEIVDMGKDVGNTVMIMQGTMKEALGGSSAENIMENINKIFESGSDVQDIIGSKKGDEALKVITDLLVNGGVDFESGVEISADSLEALTAAVSEGMTQSIKGVFDDTESINALRNSQLYAQSISEGATVSVDGISRSLDSAVNRVYDLTQQLDGMKSTQEGYDEMVQEKTELIDAITTSYLESVDNLSKDISDGNDTLTESQRLAKETADIFSSTFEKYDGAIKDSITTMNNTITEIKGKQQQTQVTNTNNPSAIPRYAAASGWQNESEIPMKYQY